MPSRTKGSTRQAAQASQAAIAAHFADEDGNTLFPRFKSGRSDGQEGKDKGERGAEAPSRTLTAAERRALRRLDDLEKTNEHDLPYKVMQDDIRQPDLASSSAKRTTQKKMSPAVRNLLTASYRKSLAEILREQPNEAYEAATADASSKPARKICLPCGALGRYRCVQCGESVCSIKCREAHEDAGCVAY